MINLPSTTERLQCSASDLLLYYDTRHTQDSFFQHSFHRAFIHFDFPSWSCRAKKFLMQEIGTHQYEGPDRVSIMGVQKYGDSPK